MIQKNYSSSEQDYSYRIPPTPRWVNVGLSAPLLRTEQVLGTKKIFSAKGESGLSAEIQDRVFAPSHLPCAGFVLVLQPNEPTATITEERETRLFIGIRGLVGWR